MAFPILLASLLLFSPRISVAQNGVTFLFPTSNLTFYYLDTVNVTWTSNFATPQLQTFCTNTEGTTSFERIDNPVPQNGYALVLLNYTNATPCWFDLRPSSAPGQGANSPQFDLNPSQRSRSTNGLSPTPSPSQVTSTISPTSTSSQTASSTTSTSSSTTTPSSSGTPVSGGLSGAAKAGIAIGAVAGAIGILAGIVLLAWKRSKNENVAFEIGMGRDLGDRHMGDGNETVDHKLPQRQALSHSQKPELPAVWMAHELDTIPATTELNGLRGL